MTSPQFAGPIRHRGPKELNALIDLFRASVRLDARRNYTQEQVLAWAPDEIDRRAWQTRYDRRPAWVAEIGATLAGVGDLEPDGHLDMLYVHPAHQGQGVATALLAQIEMSAGEQGIDCLYTQASITARPFFERRGFGLIAQQRVLIRGQSFVNFRMEKVLGLP